MVDDEKLAVLREDLEEEKKEARRLEADLDKARERATEIED